jgi:hypothetical protein
MSAGNDGQDGAAAGLGRATGGLGICSQRDGGLGGGMAANNGATAMNMANNGAGGGGGVGRVVVRTTSGALPAGPTNPTTAVIATSSLTIL